MSEHDWLTPRPFAVGDRVYLNDGDDTEGEVVQVLPDAEPDDESVQVRWLCEGGQAVWYPSEDLDHALSDDEIAMSGVGILPFFSPELGEEWNDL